MDIFKRYNDLPVSAKGAVVALGNFDGVHKGHQAVLAAARDAAEHFNVPLAVMVFDPHPREFFVPDAPPFRLTRLETKIRILEDLDVDLLFVMPFTRDFASQAAPDFVMNVLVEGLGAVHVVVGFDFRFGKGRAGDTTMLSYMGEMEGFGVTVVDAVRLANGETRDGGDDYSSTLIRTRLSDGDVKGAAGLLGRWWSIEGTIATGDQRGRTIGFPTANVSLGRLLEPKLGVYAVRIEIVTGDHQGWYDGVANLGRRPTFDKTEVLLEVHLFDFDGDIYGQDVRVYLLDFLRPEQKFSGLDALKAQIAKDSDTARTLLIEMERPLPAVPA